LGRRATNSVLSGLGELAGVEELVRCRVTWSREHALKFNFATSELSYLINQTLSVNRAKN
jgi:hypothetical protein